MYEHLQKNNDLCVLPIKARIKYKICLLAHKAIQSKERLYLNEMLEVREPSNINLRSKYDTRKLVSPIEVLNNVHLISIARCQKLFAI